MLDQRAGRLSSIALGLRAVRRLQEQSALELRAESRPYLKPPHAADALAVPGAANGNVTRNSHPFSGKFSAEMAP